MPSNGIRNVLNAASTRTGLATQSDEQCEARKESREYGE